MHDADAHVAEQFDDPVQQSEVAHLGMWTFLATEVLFFGAMFTAYIEYRVVHPGAFALGSAHMNFALGTTNTAVLLISSLTMALAVAASKEGRNVIAVLFLFVTMLLGIAFLAIKFAEYAQHFHEGLVPGVLYHADPRLQIFLSFYYLMTGLHAVHMTVGVGVVLVMIWFCITGRITAAYHNPVVIAGLYWHFVDLVWIFLYPCFYLVAKR
jgi:cytochrome c oxidase subunit III